MLSVVGSAWVSKLGGLRFLSKVTFSEYPSPSDSLEYKQAFGGQSGEDTDPGDLFSPPPLRPPTRGSSFDFLGVTELFIHRAISRAADLLCDFPPPLLSISLEKPYRGNGFLHRKWLSDL